jgi:hypothetical protein
MAKEKDFVAGFEDTDSNRIKTHLGKLFPYLDKQRFVVVGGLAIRYHLKVKGISYPIRPFNDLDIIAETIDAIDPKVATDFMVYHHHPPKDNSFYLVLVDPESRTKMDIFDYSRPPESFIKVPFGNDEIKLVSPEDQLAITVWDIQRISENSKVDPKQFSDASLLLQVVDIDLANKIWKRKKSAQWPTDINEAIKRAENIRAEHPDWVQEKPFRKPKPYVCPNCVANPQFPLTPMSKIYKVLGYVE